MGFAFIGLAPLHRFARTNPVGTVLLIASYILIIIAYFPLIIFSMMGVSRAMTNSANTPPPGGPNNV